MSRNAIVAALETRIKTALETAGLKTWSAEPKPHTDFAPELQPAAFLIMGDESNEPEPRSKWTRRAEVYVYARKSATQSAREVLNDLVDAIETACKAPAGERSSGRWSTLGGNAYAVRVTGVASDGGGFEDQGVRVVDLEIIAAG